MELLWHFCALSSTRKKTKACTVYPCDREKKIYGNKWTMNANSLHISWKWTMLERRSMNLSNNWAAQHWTEYKNAIQTVCFAVSVSSHVILQERTLFYWKKGAHKWACTTPRVTLRRTIQTFFQFSSNNSSAQGPWILAVTYGYFGPRQGAMSYEPYFQMYLSGEIKLGPFNNKFSRP
jgi:hypothetical protein